MSVRAALGAVVVLLAAAAPAAEADWPSFHNDARNTGNVPFSTYPVFKEVWWSNKTLANAQIHASPVLKDNILVTADLAGLVRGLDASSGKQLWSYKMPAPVEGTPAISGERVYVVSRDGTLAALNLRSGGVPGASTPTPEATVSVGATYGSPTYNEGKIFIGTEAGEIKAYLATTLTLLWNFPLSNVYAGYKSTTGGVSCGTTEQPAAISAQPIRGAPAVFDGKVFFGSMNHYVFAVDEQGTGDLKTTLKWMYRTSDVVIGAPSVNTRQGQEDRVIFSSYDGKVYSFEASPSGEGSVACGSGNQAPLTDIEPAWTYEVPSIKDEQTGETQVSKVHSSPASAGVRIFFGANNGNVYAVDSSDGHLLWETEAGDAQRPVTSSPAHANGIVVVGSENKDVYWIDAVSGKVLKQFTTQSAVVTSPAIDGDRAFAASQDGVLYMFGPQIPTRADLAVTSINAPSASQLQVVVRNDGDKAAENTTLRLFVGGTFLANVAVPPLEPKASATVEQAATLTGSVEVRAIVDPDNKVSESNDSNNELVKAVSAPVPSSASNGGGGGDSGGKGGGIKIPGLALPALAAGLAVALLAARRRR
jgi:outer membrane protein assembly factor BamB